MDRQQILRTNFTIARKRIQRQLIMTSVLKLDSANKTYFQSYDSMNLLKGEQPAVLGIQSTQAKQPIRSETIAGHGIHLDSEGERDNSIKTTILSSISPTIKSKPLRTLDLSLLDSVIPSLIEEGASPLSDYSPTNPFSPKPPAPHSPMTLPPLNTGSDNGISVDSNIDYDVFSDIDTIDGHSSNNSHTPPPTPVDGHIYADDGGHQDDLRNLMFDPAAACVLPDEFFPEYNRDGFIPFWAQNVFVESEKSGRQPH